MSKIDKKIERTKLEQVKENSEAINKALNLLRFGDFERARKLFAEHLKKNYSSSIAESGLKCAKYWDSRISKLKEVKSNYEKGKLLIEEWKKYEVFARIIKNLNNKVFGNIQSFVFNLALETLKSDFNNCSIDNLQLNYMIAISYKKIGNFNKSIEYFEKSLYIDSKNANILAQMADCYALIDNEKKAKLLFREAFFIDSEAVDIDLLDSNMIESLIVKIESDKIPSDKIKYWLPVYGRVYDVFNVSRELLPAELGQLKQKMFNYEKLFDSKQKSDYIKANLLNAYLWFYDYLRFEKITNKTTAINNEKKLNNVKEKINNISNEIYKELIKNTGVSR